MEQSSSHERPCHPTPPETNRRLDAIDRKILMVLQEDASLSVAEIGDRVGLSSTPCWKRIQRLEADGVILRRVALVDQNKIGLGISVFVSVESADHSDAWLKKFADAVSAMPEVMEFYRMAGDVDYMLRVVVADMQSYDVFYKKLISAVPLKNVTSRFAMEKIKSVTALPVPARLSRISDCTIAIVSPAAGQMRRGCYAASLTGTFTAH